MGCKFWRELRGNFTSLHQTTDAGYILLGVLPQVSVVIKLRVTEGSGDYWIVKIDANGIKQMG